MTAAEWALVASVIGGVVGASVKFAFEDLLSPRVAWRRDTRRLVRRFTTPLLRSAEALERRINNLIRNADERWYQDDDFYRLATLYVFGEHLGWIRIVERRFGFVPVESLRGGRQFTNRLNGIFRALTSHAYFKDADVDAVGASAVPRLMLTAVGEAMTAESGETVLEFTQFAVRYASDPQFARWFSGLDGLLDRVVAQDALSWDRLIAAGAELRALIGFLDPQGTMVRTRPLANLDRTQEPGLAAALVNDLAPWAAEPRAP